MFDFAAARETMLDSQIRTSDVTDERIQAAFLAVPREKFLPITKSALAYSDGHVDIGGGRIMIKPRDIAKMIDAADIKPTDIVLNIACGRGYSAAVLAHMAETVVALESSEELAETATQHIDRCDVTNAAVIHADLKAGAAEHGPYDVIFVGGAVSCIPAPWFAQLALGGRLVAAITDGPICRVKIFTKSADSIGERTVFDTGMPTLPGFEPKKEFAL